MIEMAIVLALAGAVGMLGATLGVRDLKRKTAITIERGTPKAPKHGDAAFASDGFGKSPQANLGL